MSNRIAIQSGYTLPSFDGLRRKKRKSSKRKSGGSQKSKFESAAKACSNGKFARIKHGNVKGFASFKSCMKHKLSK